MLVKVLGVDLAGNGVTTVHAESLAFSERLVREARQRAMRAIAHLEAMTDLGITPAKELALKHCEIATAAFRNAVGKRAFEIRSLLTDH